ncbi:MAG: DUF4270 family protein [Maribacter sp.]|nr:DUF4270 family protein [Maribacter sp.]
MTFLNRFKFATLAAILLVAFLFSCTKDLTTIGSGVIGGEPFSTGKVSYDVFAFNKKIEAVRSNKLPVYQLGIFSDPIYGKTDASITSQLQLSSPNPTFGAYSQSVEDNADNDGSSTTIRENEKIDSVYLYIPFLIADASLRDADSDGVDDEFDIDPADPNSDTDGDGVSDIRETANGTDPLNPDTDGDGILDGEDTQTLQNIFAKKFDLDSIYGVTEEEYATNPFKLKVERSTYFLRDLDPDTNFQDAQAYYSSQQFSPTFVSDVLFDDDVTINDEEILFFKKDDPATIDVDESLTVDTRLGPGIRIALDTAFFQQNILDKEGSLELLSQANFTDFLRGVHLSVSSITKDILMLLDLRRSNITMSYSYDSVNTNNTLTDTTDDTIERKQSNFILNFLQTQSNGLIIGNAINTYVNDALPPAIADNLDTNTNAEKLYIKGDAGAFSELKLFDENGGTEIINQIKAENWVINEANLVFYVDRQTLDAAANVYEPIRLYVYNADTNEFLYDVQSDPKGATSLSSYPQYDGILEKSGGKGIKYTVRITKYINDIILRDAPNATLGVMSTPEIRYTGSASTMLANDIEQNIPISSNITPLGTVLFGSNVSPSDQDKKLKLEIFYTKSN